MTGLGPLPGDVPDATEIRAAVARVIATPAFGKSPQLAHFLNFVVEETLAGRGDRLKAYTVATDAFGRDSNFDPQNDPIVRVEAGRLRQALADYYAGAGRDDAVMIEMPRGGYVPEFHRPTQQAKLRSLFAIWRARIAAATTAPFSRPAIIVASMLLGGLIFCFIDNLFIDRILMDYQASAWPTLDRTSATVSRGMFHVPTVYVEPVIIVGTRGPDTISVATLHDRLIDAFARFDDVNIVSDPASLAVRATDPTPGETQRARGPGYRLTTLVRYYRDGSTSLMFRLLDVADGTIVWSRSFDQLRSTDEAAAMEARVVRAVAMPLLQPFGVIHARERIKRANADAADHYRCLLDSHDYLRSFNPARHAAVRACLEQAVADDPTFASGFIQLARVYLREHQFGTAIRPDDPPALDRAFEMAYRGNKLKLNSARAHFILLDLNLARGGFAAAKAEGERAIALNPNDMPVVFHYGALLVLLGEVEKGEAIVREIATDSAVPPGRINFILFVAAYLKGDLEAASYHAKQMTGDPIAHGSLARALVAAKTGDWSLAKQEIKGLSARQPVWSSNPRAQLKKLFPAPAVFEKMAADFTVAAAGISN